MFMIILEGDIKKQTYKKVIKSFMDINMLSKLSEKRMSGFDFINFYFEKFGVLMSSGTVYSTLYAMERKGLIEGFKNSNKRIYQLTDKGEELNKTAKNVFGEIQNFITAFLSE